MDVTRKDSLKEKIDRLATGFAAITSIPVFGFIVKMIFDKIQERGAAALGKRIENILGVGLEDAKKDVSDEIIYGVAVSQLADLEQPEIDKFERDLRTENNGKDKDKAEAFVLFVAKIVKTFERKTDNNIQTCQNIEDGLKHAKKFLEALLKNKGANPEETFDLRVKFLEGKNVFSLIKVKKEPLKGFTDFVKKEGAEGLNKAKQGLNKAKQDTAAGTQSYKDRATARLAAAKERSNARRR